MLFDDFFDRLVSIWLASAVNLFETVQQGVSARSLRLAPSNSPDCALNEISVRQRQLETCVADGLGTFQAHCKPQGLY